MDRSEEYMKALRHQQIREYFFGHGGEAQEALAPSSMMAEFAELGVLRVGDGESGYFN